MYAIRSYYVRGEGRKHETGDDPEAKARGEGRERSKPAPEGQGADEGRKGSAEQRDQGVLLKGSPVHPREQPNPEGHGPHVQEVFAEKGKADYRQERRDKGPAQVDPKEGEQGYRQKAEASRVQKGGGHSPDGHVIVEQHAGAQENPGHPREDSASRAHRDTHTREGQGKERGKKILSAA